MESNRQLTNVNLKSSPDGPMVVLPNEEGQRCYEPFAFPPLPWSTMNWLGTLSDKIWNQHQVCCALLLLLNPERRCWGVTVPRQESRRDGVSWQLEDFVPNGNTPDTPRHAGGSFQMSVADDPEQAMSLVPQTDGLHLVHPVGMEPAGVWMFLRVEGELTLENPNDIVVDDWSVRCTDVMRVLGLAM
ncbi:MAG: hypothetical protein ACPG4Q_11015 [Phycisphaeraceae bacterium]